MFNKPWRYDGVQNEDLFWRFAKKTSFAQKLSLEKQEYNEKKQRMDQKAGIKLLLSAKKIAASAGIYFRKKGKLS